MSESLIIQFFAYSQIADAYSHYHTPYCHTLYGVWLESLGGDETSEADKEESSISGDYCSGGLRISFIMVIEEETSSSAGRECIRSREMVTS